MSKVEIKNHRIPNIRFPDYHDEWKSYAMKELYIQRNEQGNSLLPILSVSIHTGVSDGELDPDSLGKQVRRSEDKSKYKHVYSGDLIFNMMRAWQGAIGVAKNEGMVSPAYISAIPNDEVYPPFMNYLFQRKDMIDQINNLSYGVTDFRKRLYWDSFEKVKCMLPSINEQKDITDFFEKLDHSISINEKDIEDWKVLKKCLLQRMFPKEEKTVPEIRFPGFTDDWEQRKCGDVLTERNIQHPQSNEYPLVSFTVENGVTPKTDRYEREQLVTGDKAAKKYKETRLNDIVYNPANLKFGAIARNKYGNAVFSPIYVTYEVDEQIALPAFVEMFVTRESFIQNALQYQQGTVYERMSVNTDDFANLEIMLPSKEEQYQIGELFASLDNTITLHQRKLNDLKELKKGLLQQMFI
ncbi:restriction endonuclease subunit S [Lactimicrobium massiliense]|uniref:restriction endonuclease subunit S n=1 Tax=Lactimicrobium massiliense TaxID=2161814 RepID=UPI001AE97344|nr:restriction endonuclease subunit S [Lactimicrobium massiliense]